MLLILKFRGLCLSCHIFAIQVKWHTVADLWECLPDMARGFACEKALRDTVTMPSLTPYSI